MKIPDFRGLMHRLSGIALFLSGMIIGAAVYMSIHQHNFHELYIMYQDLRIEKEQLLSEIKKLDTFKNNRNVIKSIKVRSVKSDGDGDIDEVTLNEIEKKVYKDLEKFIGQKISTFIMLEDIDTTRDLINKRYLIKDKDYVVQLKSSALIQTELTVWIAVKEFKKS